MKVSFGVSLGAVLLQREDAQQFMDLVKMADDYGIEAWGPMIPPLSGEIRMSEPP